MQFQYRKIVFLTGAGISAESGLSLFRGKNGLWNNRNPEEVATAEALLQRRSDVLDFYNGLRHEMAEAKPNAAHLAISRLTAGLFRRSIYPDAKHGYPARKGGQ